MNLASASGHKIDVLGTLDVDVRVGSTASKNEFIVSRQLHADVLLGCQLIDKAINSIHIQQKTVELVNGETIPIWRQRGRSPMPLEMPDDKRISTDTTHRHYSVKLRG